MNEWHKAKQTNKKPQENERYGEDPKSKSKWGGVTRFFFHVFSNSFYNVENGIFKKCM